MFYFLNDLWLLWVYAKILVGPNRYYVGTVWSINCSSRRNSSITLYLQHLLNRCDVWLPKTNKLRWLEINQRGQIDYLIVLKNVSAITWCPFLLKCISPGMRYSCITLFIPCVSFNLKKLPKESKKNSHRLIQKSFHILTCLESRVSYSNCPGHG